MVKAERAAVEKVKEEEKVEEEKDVDPQVARMPQEDGQDSINHHFHRRSFSLVDGLQLGAVDTLQGSHHEYIVDHFHDHNDPQIILASSLWSPHLLHHPH